MPGGAAVCVDDGDGQGGVWIRETAGPSPPSRGERRALISRLVPLVDRDRPEVAAQACLTQADPAFEQGDWAESVLAGREGLRRFLALGQPRLAAWCRYMQAFGALLVVGGAPLDHVSELAGAADSLRAASGHHHRPWELRGRYRVDHALAGRWDEPAVRQAELCGRGHDLARAVERAQALLPRPGT